MAETHDSPQNFEQEHIPITYKLLDANSPELDEYAALLRQEIKGLEDMRGSKATEESIAHYELEPLKKGLEKDPSKIISLAAMENGKVVGAMRAQIFPLTKFKDYNSGHVIWVVVEKEKRRKKIATGLYAELEKILRQRKIDCMTASVDKRNPTSLRAHENIGLTIPYNERAIEGDQSGEKLLVVLMKILTDEKKKEWEELNADM